MPDRRRQYRYAEIAQEVQDAIEKGEYTEGDKLPGENAIMERYDVARATARDALAVLRNKGIAVARRGSGVFVRTSFPTIRRSSPRRLTRQQWGEGLPVQQADTEDRPRTVNVEVGETAASEWVAQALGIAHGQTVVYRSRQFVVDDRAVQLATSYLPLDLASGTPIMYTDTGPGGVYARLAEAGHAPTSFTEYLRARMPRPDETESLELSEGSPVLEITRHALTDTGQCVEVNRMVLDGTAYLLDYTFPA